MKRIKAQRTVATVFVLVVLLALPLVLHAQDTDPLSVTKAEMECINAGDLDCLFDEIYAEDMVVTFVEGSDVTTLVGHEEWRPVAEAFVAEHFRMEYSDFSVDGDTVTFTARSWSDSINAMGIAPNVATEVQVVQDGKIKSLEWTLSDESLAKLEAAMANLPETGGGGFPIQAVVVGLGGLAVAGGLGLELVRRRLR